MGGREWGGGAGGGDVENPEGWRSVGSAQFPPPALGTSLELTQATMLACWSEERAFAQWVGECGRRLRPASCASQGKHHSLLLHLPRAGEVTLEALVASSIAGS